MGVSKEGLKIKNDTAGKLYELSLALSMSNSNTFPVDYRSGDATAPKTWEKLSVEAGIDITNQIYGLAKEASEIVKTKLVEDGLMANTTDVYTVHWVSQPSDHESMFSYPDPNAYCDVAVTTSLGAVGLSAKYGSTKYPNLRNAGLGTLKDMFEFKMPVDEFERHEALLKELGYTGSHEAMHLQYKADKQSSAAKLAVASSSKVKTAVANAIRLSATIKSTYQLKDLIVQLASPKTSIPHYIVHTRLDNPIEHSVYEATKKTMEVLSKYSKLFVSIYTKGTSVSIKGTRTFDGQDETVATIGIKNQSGPMKTINSTFTMPSLVRKKRRRVLHAFDLDDTLFWHPKDGSAAICVRGVDGKLSARLSTSELGTHVLEPGEHYDYSELKSTIEFERTAKPLWKVIEKLNSCRFRNKVEIVTARSDFDDEPRFLDFLRANFINPDEIAVRMCGNYDHLSSTPLRKVHYFENAIAEWGYDEIHLYDDQTDNLDHFVEMRTRYSNVEFIPHIVKYDPKKNTCSIRKWKRP